MFLIAALLLIFFATTTVSGFPYYRQRFPSLWERFDAMITVSRITSTREVFQELQGHGDDLAQWCRSHRQQVFVKPAKEELDVVKEIFSVSHFQTMISKKNRLEGKPVADPFVIARAKCLKDGCVVTTEKYSPNAAKIPNVCADRRFKVDWVSLEGFMEHEQWEF